MSFTTQLIVEGVDNASRVFQDVGNSVESVNGKVTTFAETQQKATFSAKDLAVGLSGVATAGFGLYMGFERIQKSQVALDRANLNVQRSTETLDQTTKNYNATIAKYGVGSAEAKDAADKLAIAQDSLTVAQERAVVASDNTSNSFMFMALSVVPTIITGVASAVKAFESLGGATKAFSAALTFLSANPIILVVAGIATLAAGLVYAYNTCPPVRDALNAVGFALKIIGEYILNNLLGAINALVGGFQAVYGAVGGFFSWVSNGLNTVSNAISRSVGSWNETFVAATDAIENSYARMSNTVISAQKNLWSTITNENRAEIEAARAATDAQAKVFAEQTKLFQEHADSLTSFYTDKFVKPTEQYRDSLAVVAGQVDAIMNEANENTKIKLAFSGKIIEGFARQWGMSWDDAKAVITDAVAKIEAETAKVPQTIEEQLVTKAQNDLAAFEKCATGKFAGITAIGTDSMNTLVSDVNDLLGKGLVGEAQDLIKQFQDCSTNKAADLADSIQASLDEMVKNGIKSVADMEKYSTLSGWLDTLRQQASEAAAIVSNAYAGVGVSYPNTANPPSNAPTAGTEPKAARIPSQGPTALESYTAGQANKFGGGGAGVQINAPLVYIEGSADRKTADYAVQIIQDKLENVLISNTSTGATTQRITLATKSTPTKWTPT